MEPTATSVCEGCGGILAQNALCFACWIVAEDQGPAAPGYTIDKSIGKGGMGQVFAARRLSDGLPFAIKCLAGGESTLGFRKRFAREAKLLSSLSHPGIVRFVEWIQDGDENYIVMELVEGQTLSALRPISHAAAVIIGMDICDALIYAHAQGIIHRDIKPSNILVTSEGRAKVVDFGIARPIVSASGHTLTSTNAVVGTPFFTAPEVTMGEMAGPLLDVYSLGVLLYNAVTGEYPVGNYEAVAEPLNTVVRRATAYKPEKRYQDVISFRKDLSAVHSGDGLTPSQSQAMTAAGRRSSTTPSPSYEKTFETKNNTNKAKRSSKRTLVGLAILSVVAVGTLLWWPSAKSTLGATAPLGQKTTKFVPASKERLDAGALLPLDAALTLTSRDAGSSIQNKSALAKRPRVILNKKADAEVNKTVTKKGNLVIHVRPWGEVHIDGKFAGRSEPPSGKRFSLAEGRHAISVRNSVTGSKQDRQVTVDSQRPLTLRIDLRKKSGGQL